MKGIMFNLLESCVTEEFGERTWDDVLEACGLDGAYTSLGNYPDEHLAALLGGVAKGLGRSVPATERWFGRQAIAPLAARYPEFFEVPDTRSFVLTLNDVIHAEVKKLYPGADVPVFEFVTGAAGRVTLIYRSARRLCQLAEGLVEGAALQFEERAVISQAACMRRGDDACVIECAFEPAGGDA